MVTSHIDPYLILWDSVIVPCQLGLLVILAQQLCHQLGDILNPPDCSWFFHLRFIFINKDEVPCFCHIPKHHFFLKSCFPFFSQVRFTPILKKKIFWALCCCHLKPRWVQRAELCLPDTDGCSQFAALTVSVSVLWQSLSLFLSRIPAAQSRHLR